MLKKLIAPLVAIVVLLGVGWFALDQKNTVALVNNEKVTKQDLDKILAQQMLLDPTFDKTSADNIKQATQMVVGDRLMLQQAKKLNVAVTDDEMKPQLDNLRTWLENHILSQSAQAKQLNPDDTKLGGTDQAQATAERQRLETGLNTTASALLDKKLAEQKITFTDITNYVKNQALIEKVVNKLADSTTVTDDQIKQYYDTNKDYKYTTLVASHILVADEKTAQDVLAQLKAGADFKAMSDKYSTDEAAKAQGGSLGEFGHGDMDPAFEQAAYLLMPGQLSEVVHSSFGYHIIRLDDRKVAPFDQIKDQIKQELQNAQMNDTIKKIMTDANIKPKAVKDNLVAQNTGA